MSWPRLCFEQIGGALERRGALLDRRRRPAGKAGCGRGHRRAHDGLVAFAHHADRAAVDRRNHRALDAGQRDAVDQRRGFGRLASCRRELRRSSASRLARSPNSTPARILPLRLDRDRAAAGFCGLRASRAAAIAALRPAQNLLDRHARIGGDRDERGIGAVFQQPPHQIGEEIAVAADRARRRGTPRPAIRPAAPRRAPRPCRAGAETRSPRRRRRPRSRWRR